VSRDGHNLAQYGSSIENKKMTFRFALEGYSLTLAWGFLLISGNVAYSQTWDIIRSQIQSSDSPLIRIIEKKPRILLTVVAHNEQATHRGCAPLYESTPAGATALTLLQTSITRSQFNWASLSQG